MLMTALAARRALDASAQHLVRVAPPPVELGEDLHFLEAGVAGALGPAADARQVDDAVAHHAAVVEEIARRHEPVADVIGEHPLLSGARDLLLELRVPPDVIDVERHAEAIAQLLADIERLLER